MFKLCYFQHGKWRLHSVGTWSCCIDLGHMLFGQKIDWVINQLGEELKLDYTVKGFKVRWCGGNLSTTHATVEKANEYALGLAKQGITDSEIIIQ
jgi:hypothetical protein